MRLLITSDIHGDRDALEAVIKKHPDIDTHLNAGDLCLEKQVLEQYHLIAVKGNNDFYLDLPLFRVLQFETLRVFLTHGHLEHVKMSLDRLRLKASIHQANLVIFGHTHKPYLTQENGIIFLNPGALGDHRHSYAVYDHGEVTFHNVYEP
ncbi:MAG: YfcE family phosphodiesterase [Acholeplasmataceae bacterium]|nr:YfcE family phosphodiesterase [Acholeplasmataceae bacterium]